MSKEFSGVIKNSLFAMVDLFLDYVSLENLDSQRENISEFITDCHNLKYGDQEFELLQLKFEEEFENVNYFMELDKGEVSEVIESAINKLIYDKEIPSLIKNAINEVY